MERREKGTVPEPMSGSGTNLIGKGSILVLLFTLRCFPISISMLPQCYGTRVPPSTQEIQTSREDIWQGWIARRGWGHKDTQWGYQSAYEGKSKKKKKRSWFPLEAKSNSPTWKRKVVLLAEQQEIKKKTMWCRQEWCWSNIIISAKYINKSGYRLFIHPSIPPKWWFLKRVRFGACRIE